MRSQVRRRRCCALNRKETIPPLSSLLLVLGPLQLVEAHHISCLHSGSSSGVGIIRRRSRNTLSVPRSTTSRRGTQNWLPATSKTRSRPSSTIVPFLLCGLPSIPILGGSVSMLLLRRSRISSPRAASTSRLENQLSVARRTRRFEKPSARSQGTCPVRRWQEMLSEWSIGARRWVVRASRQVRPVETMLRDSSLGRCTNEVR